MPGDGIYKSTDAGKTWTHIGFRDAQNISRDPHSSDRTPNIVFVAAFGQHGVPNDERGIFKSTDGGATWRKVLFANAQTGGVDLSHRSQQPERDLRGAVGGVPQGIHDVERRPGQRAVQVHGRRRDVDGDHAQPRHAEGGMVGRIGVSVSGADSNRVYALVENENGGLLALRRRRRDVDAGRTANRNIRQRAFYYTHVAADPKSKDTVYLLNVSAYQVDRRRQDDSRPAAAGRTATITTSGSTRTIRSTW